MLRLPTSNAPATPVSAEPPAPSTPTSANCDPPVKASNARAQACSVDRPAVTAAAPKERPDRPTAKPNAAQSRITLLRSSFKRTQTDGETERADAGPRAEHGRATVA